jgi:uncharacterized coiled-coil protein SlyX
MSDENEQKKEHSKISIRIGNAQVELEGTIDNIRKLMDKELVDFTKGLEATTKQLPSSTEITPKITPKTPEVTPKEKPVPPPSKPSVTSETPSQTPRVPTIRKPPEKMSKKKILSRNAAIALVLVLVLLASLVSVIAIYVPMVGNLESQVAEQNDTISSLTAQNLALQSALNQTASNLNAKIANLTSELNYLTSEYNSTISGYNDIISLGLSMYLAESASLTQEANSSTIIWNNSLYYAGYIAVQLQSTSNTTYARVVYSSYGVNFDQNITLGESGSAAFPILPGAVLFSVGNTEPVNSINATLTAIYAY